MPAPRIRADHDALSKVAGQFSQQSDQVSQMTQKLKQKKEVLQGKDWVGKGADKFYAEMDGSVFPSLNRLARALDRAGRITSKISKIMKQAEDDASSLFKQGGESGGSAGAAAGAGGDLGSAAGAAAGAAAGGAVGAAAGSSGGGSSGGGAASGAGGGAASGGATGASSGGGGGGGSPSSGGGAASGGATGGSSGGGGGAPAGGGAASNPLISTPPSQVFSPANLGNLASSNFQGAGSPELADAMAELAQNPTGAALDAVLAKIAKLRGVPLDKIKKDFEKFLKIRAQAAANAAAKGLPPPPPLSEALQGEFAGSLQQLRSGSLLGETFGIDPVFGAMLNPQGGLGVGTSVPDPNTAVGLNEAATDASTYLQNFHNTGPGASYLGQGADTLGFWQQKLVNTLSNA